jgi:signal transduction histidine kinase
MSKANSTFDLNFLANFTHQVINPLNGVAGTLDNLVEGTIKEKWRQEQRLNAARAQLEQCITLMRNLAFLSQGVAGFPSSGDRKIVLPQVIIEAAQFYQEHGKAKSIEINLTDRSTQNIIMGHPELIRQVLMNIFDNCVKYGMHGSEIVINQRVQSHKPFAIIEIQSRSMYPINPLDAPKVFELGFRGKNAVQTVASGTGLGLYICKEIITHHKGTIDLVSNKDGRVDFTIKLPIANEGKK